MTENCDVPSRELSAADTEVTACQPLEKARQLSVSTSSDDESPAPNTYFEGAKGAVKWASVGGAILLTLFSLHEATVQNGVRTALSLLAAAMVLLTGYSGAKRECSLRLASFGVFCVLLCTTCLLELFFKAIVFAAVAAEEFPPSQRVQRLSLLCFIGLECALAMTLAVYWGLSVWSTHRLLVALKVKEAEVASSRHRRLVRDALIAQRRLETARTNGDIV